jgi:Zn-finger nucleic acid-binding protein
MKCPNCEATLMMTERQGVEIDYCPKCRGVWLDKGELDKIIEKSTAAESSQQLKQNDMNRDRRDDDDDDDDDDNGGFLNRNKNQQNNPNRRRGGFLSNLFDFD